MTDLIVDFPDCTRRCPSSCNRKPKKSVQFSQMFTIKFVKPINKTDVDSLWYSRQDYKAMRIATRENVQYAQSRLSSNHAKDLDIDMLTGIENLLTPTLIKKTRACRAQCRHAVLDEQERQDRSGVCNPIRIALVSQKCSASSIKRARNIGSIQQSR